MPSCRPMMSCMPGVSMKASKKPDFEGAGIGEQVLDAGGLGLRDHQFAAGAFEGPAPGRRLEAGGAFGGVGGFEDGARSRQAEAESGHIFEESAAREAAIQVAANEILHQALRCVDDNNMQGVVRAAPARWPMAGSERNMEANASVRKSALAELPAIKVCVF